MDNFFDLIRARRESKALISLLELSLKPLLVHIKFNLNDLVLCSDDLVLLDCFIVSEQSKIVILNTTDP